MSFRAYVQHGWKLCAIEKRQKGPTYDRWQLNPIDEEVADGVDGAGLLHALSGTCALDIDNISLARDWLMERGVDLDSLLESKDAVRIDSGTPNRAKLLYRLKVPMRTVKPKSSGIELRCATLGGTSAQDVLPPSIHPSGRKYEWKYAEPLLGDWASLPAIPAALKAAWRELIAEEPPMPQTNGDMDVALEKLHTWIVTQDPNMEYDDWLKVGMKLHHATHGAEEGLELWGHWSKQATRSQHGKTTPVQDSANCRAHWVSFSSTKGKVLATLDNEIPADADEFDIVPIDTPAKAADDTPIEKKVREAAQQQRKDAIAKLEARLVYVVNSEKYFDVERHRLIGSEAALEHMFTSSMPLNKSGRLNPVKVLKNSKSKRLVEGLGFHPGEGALFQVGDDTFANNYRNRLPTPLEPTPEEFKKINWLFDRIDDVTYCTWLKQYYAHVVQRPAIKIKSAPLLWSETQRNGKSTLIKTIPMLLVGREYSEDVNHDLLNSPFNDYLQSAWHVNLTEFRAGTRSERNMVYNKLKAYIADDMVTVHPKGGRGYTMPNHAFVTASSNNEDAATIDNNDERWGVHEFKQPKFTHSEREWIYNEFLLLPRAAAVLRHYFLHVDLKGFYAAGSAPMTDAKADMASASMASDREMLLLMFEEHAEMFSRDIVVTSEVMAYVHKHSSVRPSANRIGKILTSDPFNGIAIQFRAGEGRFRGVIIRNHQKWKGLSGRQLKDHIDGDDDIEIDLMS
jgi:hypothetical protein